MAASINQVILNFLDRMIDENIRSAETMASLRSIIAEHRAEHKESLGEIQNKIEKLQEHFANGFGVDIKDHVSSETKAIQDMLLEFGNQLEKEEDRKKRLDHYDRFGKFLDKISSPKFWAALFVSFIVGVATLLGAADAIWSKINAIVSKKNPSPSSHVDADSSALK